MKQLVLLFTFLFSISFISGQTVIWSDDFESTSANWSLNDPSGTNNPTYSNIWNISDAEGGVAPTGCSVSGNGNKTLFVSCNPTGTLCPIINPSGRAKYNAGGIGGIDPTTNKRSALTTPINTVGITGLTIDFDWMGVAQAGNDYAELEYSIDGGITWVSIWTQSQSPTCTAPEVQWQTASVPLPTACENQTDLRFAFNWHNDNDGAGSDPSFAANDMELYTSTPTPTGPTADFNTASYSICENDCISFTDASTGQNIASWNWTFDGASTTTSTSQNPTNICFPTAGTYDVKLIITDDNGTDSITKQITVTSCSSPTPTADFTTTSLSICESDCISFTDVSSGQNIASWNWTFDGASTTTSTSQNPTNICYPSAGTYDVKLVITDDNGTDSITKQIIVDNCTTNPPPDTTTTPPVAGFVIDSSTVCKGDCISFTDISTGNPTSWLWTFEGATPSSSTVQNPQNICFDSIGPYNITLVVSNSAGNDQVTSQVNVLSLPKVIGLGDTTIEMHGEAHLTAVPIDSGSVFWTPSEFIDCPTCLDVTASPFITTTYYPSIVDANGCVGRDTVLVTVKFEEIVDVPSAFSPNGDGLNDLLHVLGVGIIEINFKIYNRYGQMVYSSTDVEEGWNGTFNGKPLNQGVFVYTLEFQLVDGSSGEKSGNITLIK